MTTVISLIIALSVLVFVHEFGHFIAAKRSGVVVEEFAMGYPPRVWTLWRGRGEIVIDGKKIVIPRRFDLPEGLRARSLVTYKATADDMGNLALTHIKEVNPDSPEAASASHVDFLAPGTIYSINAIPFGGFTKMLGEEDPTFPGSLASKNKRTRVLVLVAGAGMNLLTAVLFFALAYGVGVPAAADPENAVIREVAAGSPAEAAGLQPGDIVVQAGGTAILTMEDLQVHTQAHLGQEVMLTIQRDGQTLTIGVVPRTNPPQGQGAMGVILGRRTTVKQYVWYEALWTGLKETVAMCFTIATFPVQLIRGLIPMELARPIGPVGVGQLMGDAVQSSIEMGWWYPVLLMMGSLSVAVAMTNLLPLPGLDGGRILFVAVEAIRGKRVDPAREGLVHLIGMLLLVALMFVLIWQDLVNPLPSLNWGGF
ncbi:MAG: site-2 protease family protein [Anaerolineae bacterium]|nr:site-2 protease family protein [Anaerolineae bacterium]